MQQLEEKLSTLSNGTQAVAEVLSNWNGVLRAVYMASGMHTRILSTIRDQVLTRIIAKIPKPKEADADADVEAQDSKPELPQTLVRIPVHQAEAAQKEAEAAAEAAGE
jgi:DASH complex subunit DAD2